jgi:CheY-like chemotaxis protein
MVAGKHRDTRFMLRVLLEMWGYQVIETECSEETVWAAEAVRPNVIVLDTSLLYDDDLMVLNQIRTTELTADVPVLVLSGFPQPSYRQAAFDRGATGLLVKPLDIDLLENYLREYTS